MRMAKSLGSICMETSQKWSKKNGFNATLSSPALVCVITNQGF